MLGSTATSYRRNELQAIFCRIGEPQGCLCSENKFLHHSPATRNAAFEH